MRKLYLALAALVPGILAALSSAGYGQSNPGTPPPGITGNPGPNNPQSDQTNQPNAPSRARNSGTMSDRAMKNSGMTRGKPSTATDADATGPSVAPGSAPKGSNEPQMTKPRPRDASPMDSDAPSSSLPPPGATEGADVSKP